MQSKRGCSLERRLRAARIGAFKARADFDWTWPSRVDREAIDELLALKLVDDGVKTMILRNIAHEATLRGHTVRFTSASDMLSDLAAQGVVGRARPAPPALRPCGACAPFPRW
jgi:IstB-like ATP binding protein